MPDELLWDYWRSVEMTTGVNYVELPMVAEMLKPFVELAQRYRHEGHNGVLEDIACNRLDPSDHRAVMDATVKDFMGYVAAKLRVNLPADTWED